MSDSLPSRSQVIDFGTFRLVPAARSLTRNGEPVHLGDRALDILIALIERHGQIVSKKELFKSVWPQTVVVEGNLRVNVAALRKALGDGQQGTRLIANIPGRGYSFIAEVRRSGTGGRDLAPPVTTEPELRSSLPAPMNRLLGRDEVIAAIGEELPGRRLVTITGAGGIGKTVVALAVAEKCKGVYRDGVIFLDLATLPESALVTAHLASVLRLPTTNLQPLDSIVTHLTNRHLLLLLDNCEHVIDAAAEIAMEILKRAGEVHILATSREPLRAPGEWVWRLAPLACPPVSTPLNVQQVVEYAAARLFVERVSENETTSPIADADAPSIADLCTKLDGLPLAIELAAARVSAFGIRGVDEHLGDRFHFLTKGRRTAVPRHQTIGAMIDWSYQTLTEEERRVWRRLAVFSGVFTLGAATTIGGAGGAEQHLVVDVLDSLVEKSLLAVEVLGTEARYRMLESLRLYATTKLQESEEAESIGRAHAEYYCHRLLDSGESWLEAPSAQWLQSHSGDIADIRAAIEWAFLAEQPVLAIKLIGASAPFWFKLLLVPELLNLLERALRLAPGLDQMDDELIMQLHFARGAAIYHALGSTREASASFAAALALAEKRGDINAQLQVLWAQYASLATRGYYADALPSVDGVARIMVEHPEALATPLYNRMAAFTYHLLGEQHRALHHAELALDHIAVMQRASRDGVFVYDHKTTSSAHYARILWMTGRPDAALDLIQSRLEDVQRIGQPFAHGFFLVFAAIPISLWTGDSEAAKRHVSSVLDVATGIASYSVWWSMGKSYELVLKGLDNPGGPNSVLIGELLADKSLSPYMLDSLGTFSWRMVHPRVAAAASQGTLHWCTAEILRASAEGLLDGGGERNSEEAERLLQRSIAVSRNQSALSWELRGAISLARLWHTQHRTAQAEDLLASVYNTFTEGHTTRDLIEAKALLDVLMS